MNFFLFVKDKLLPHVDIPGQVENTKSRANFTVFNPHNTKLFLPAHLVRQEYPCEVNSNAPDATAGSTVAQQKMLIIQDQMRKLSQPQGMMERNKQNDEATIKSDAIGQMIREVPMGVRDVVINRPTREDNFGFVLRPNTGHQGYSIGMYVKEQNIALKIVI